MSPGRSLSLRLLVLGTGLIAAALTAAWLMLGYLFERHLERQLQAELERHGLSLIAALRLDPNGKPLLEAQPFDHRFGRPAGGLYWRISGSAGTLVSRSLWDGALPGTDRSPTPGWRASSGEGPFEREVMTVTRQVQFGGAGERFWIEVAGDRAPIRRARTAFGFETGVFLGVLWLVLAMAALMQVRLGLAPLEQVRREVANLNRLPGARLTNAKGPREIGPLTTAVNELLDARAADMERARRRTRDLAHALKTPLTALRLQIDALDDDRRAELVETLLLVTGTVEGELARTLEADRPSFVSASAIIDRLWAVLARTPEGGALELRNETFSSLILPMTDEGALEVLGAILENAVRFASGVVVVSGEQDETGVRLFIDDDGPGIPPDIRHLALERGMRLDERGGRHGLGLAIAFDRVQASGGRLALAASPSGGLRVELQWPGAPKSPRSHEAPPVRRQPRCVRSRPLSGAQKHR